MEEIAKDKQRSRPETANSNEGPKPRAAGRQTDLQTDRQRRKQRDQRGMERRKNHGIAEEREEQASRERR